MRKRRFNKVIQQPIETGIGFWFRKDDSASERRRLIGLLGWSQIQTFGSFSFLILSSARKVTSLTQMEACAVQACAVQAFADPH